jgi:hypothetical protein
MLAAVKKRATFANICSFLALSIVLSMGTAYAADTVRSKDIVNGQVKTVDLGNNAVTTGKLKDGQVGLVDLDTNSVDATKISDASVGAADLATSSVGSDEIATDAVNATEIADSSIDSGEIVADSLLASDLAPGSVGTSEIIDGTVSGTDIASSTITGGNVASNSIGTSDLVGIDISGSINIPSGYVPIGQCKSLDISISGAIADQAIILSARAALPVGQLLYGSEVPSDGHGTMVACNLSGSTWDALSSFPVRIVTFG